MASMITPVPGGVGPMTIAMLMQARLAAPAPCCAQPISTRPHPASPAARRARSRAPSASSPPQAGARGGGGLRRTGRVRRRARSPAHLPLAKRRSRVCVAACIASGCRAKHSSRPTATPPHLGHVCQAVGHRLQVGWMDVRAIELVVLAELNESQAGWGHRDAVVSTRGSPLPPPPLGWRVPTGRASTHLAGVVKEALVTGEPHEARAGLHSTSQHRIEAEHVGPVSVAAAGDGAHPGHRRLCEEGLGHVTAPAHRVRSRTGSTGWTMTRMPRLTDTSSSVCT